MLTTPEKSDVGTFGSTRFAGESGGAPATIVGNKVNALANAELVHVRPITAARMALHAISFVAYIETPVKMSLGNGRPAL